MRRAKIPHFEEYLKQVGRLEKGEETMSLQRMIWWIQYHDEGVVVQEFQEHEDWITNRLAAV